MAYTKGDYARKKPFNVDIYNLKIIYRRELLQETLSREVGNEVMGNTVDFISGQVPIRTVIFSSNKVVNYVSTKFYENGLKYPYEEGFKYILNNVK